MSRDHPERRLLIAVAEYLAIMAHPNVVWSHFPAGELRTKATAALLTRCGLRPGWPDLILIRDGGVYGLELKTGRVRQSKAQKQVERQFIEAGAIYILCRGWDETIAALEHHDLVKEGR